MTTQTTHPVQTLLRPGSLARHIVWRIERKDALGMLLVLFVFSLVGWLYLTQAKSAATVNLQIEEYRQEITGLNQQIAKVEVQIAEYESLDRIEQRASQIGFAPPATSLYLSVPDYPGEDATNLRASRVEGNP
jgi:cell division protein FtsL